jgi:hypothetical protein
VPHALKKAIAGALIAAMSGAVIVGPICPAAADTLHDIRVIHGWGKGHVTTNRFGGPRHRPWQWAGYYSGRWAFPFMPYPYYGYGYTCYGNGWPDYPPYACGYFYPQ